ncbi:MAG: PAS domain-containing protein [bacterium]
MDLILRWFQSNMDIIFFIYGTAFVALGIAVLVQPKKDSEFKLAGILWLLAGFGITHGLNEWLDMWSIIKGSHPVLDMVRWFVLVISYFFLFEFGRRLFRITGQKCPVWRQKSANVFIRQLLPVIGFFILITGFISADFWKTGSIWTRYLLGFPGGLLIGFGFFFYYECEKETLRPLKVKKHFLVAGLTFVTYGILGGLVVPKGNFFPANWLNTDSFCLTAHIPVQVFRAVCAVLAAWSVGGMLKIFNWEQRKKIQDAFLMRERITEGIGEGILLIDKDFKIIWANKKIRDVYGDVIGDYCYHATHKRNTPCQPPNDPCPLLEVLKTGKPRTFLHTHLDKENNPVFFETSVYPVRNGKGEITEFVHLAKDVTERVKLEETIKSIGNPLIVTDPKGKIVVANRLVLHLLGYKEEEIFGKSIGKIFTEEEEELQQLLHRLKLDILLESGSVRNFETKIFTKEKKEIPVSLRASLVKREGKLVGFVCVFGDLREIRKLQEQLIQTEKLTSLGMLVGGVAHELNNPLTAVLSLSQLILCELNSEDAEYQNLKTIESSALRCRGIIQQLLDFSRKQSVKFQPVDVNKAIENAVSLAGHQIELDNIKIIKNLAVDLPPVSGNMQQLEQVFINLMTNARDAMPEGGQLTISTRPGKDCMEIRFTDTGEGIPEEAVGKIFDPFFTTKPQGKGTGLGLSVCYGIIKKHSGRFEVESEQGKGTTFKIVFSILK